MIRRRPLHYFSAVLVLLMLGAIANVELASRGDASGRHQKKAEGETAVADPGVNAFTTGARRNLDLAFYEDFMRTTGVGRDGFDEEKTGQWSKGSPKGVGNFVGGKGPDLQNASDIASVLAKPSGVHTGGPFTPGGGSPIAPELTTAALIGAGPLVLPGVIQGGFTPPGGPPPPPTSEVPVPPAAVLFLSALALAARRRKLTIA